MAQQNLVSLRITNEDLTALAGAIDTVRTTLGDRAVSLTPTERQRLVKMGDTTRPFCEQTVQALQANSSSLPADFALEELNQDMADWEAFSAFASNFEQVAELVSDTKMAIGSDIMNACILGAGGLKFANKLTPQLDNLLRDLTSLRRRKAAKKSTPDKPATP